MTKQQHKQRVQALYRQYQDWFEPTGFRWGAFELESIPGWLSFIQELLAGIRKHLTLAKQDAFRIVQINEKFGTLRFYYQGQDVFVDQLGAGPSTSLFKNRENEHREIDGLVSEATNMSAQTCMYCGEPGRIRTDGWWTTLCDRHDSLSRSGKSLHANFEHMTSLGGGSGEC